jgi:ubiquinone/menaquinone biosynthesis C-methylase UbiE
MNYYWDEFIQEIRDNIGPEFTLLDAGAGDCHWKQYFPTARYIAMDLGIGDENCDYSNLDIKGDLRSIPLDSSSVDVIISIQVLEHLPEPWKVLDEFHRVLKKKGVLYITCPQAVEQHQVPYDFFRYTPFGLQSLLENSGFEVSWIKSQLGNFSKIIDDVCYSLRKLTAVANNPFEHLVFKFSSFYVRQVLWRLHRPFFLYLDRFEVFQDNSTGHFVKARKC